MDTHLLTIFVREIRLPSRFALAAYQGMQQELIQLDQRSSIAQQELQSLITQQQSQASALFDRLHSGDMTTEEFEEEHRAMFQQHRAELIESAEDSGHWPVFYFAYSFLLHAAIVSKILWPGPTVHGREKRKVGPDKVEELLDLHENRGPAIRQALQIADSSAMLIQNTDIRDDLEHYDERLEAWYVASLNKNMADLGLMPRNAISGFESIDYRRNIDPATLFFYIEGNDFDLVNLANELQSIDEKARCWLRNTRVQ